MDDRQQHLAAILNIQPIIAQVVQDEVLTDLTVLPNRGLSIANRLQTIDSDVARSRSEFVRQQVSGAVAGELFGVWCEKW